MRTRHPFRGQAVRCKARLLRQRGSTNAGLLECRMKAGQLGDGECPAQEWQPPVLPSAGFGSFVKNTNVAVVRRIAKQVASLTLTMST